MPKTKASRRTEKASEARRKPSADQDDPRADAAARAADGAAARARARARRVRGRVAPPAFASAPRPPPRHCLRRYLRRAHATTRRRSPARTAHTPRRPHDQKETTREEEPSRQRSRHEMAHHRDPGARDPGGRSYSSRSVCVMPERWADVARARARVCVLVAASCLHQRSGDALLFAEQHLTTPSEQKYNSGERSEGTRVVKMRSACATIPKNAQPASEAKT